jgi:hypothetical protein
MWSWNDDAGLRVVRRIRADLANQFVRIILRTGQTGKAPETQVIARYDIKDYKEKTELTAQKRLDSIMNAGTETLSAGAQGRRDPYPRLHHRGGQYLLRPAAPQGCKPAWPPEHVLGYIRQNRGRRFDPVMVFLFRKVVIMQAAGHLALEIDIMNINSRILPP